MEAILVVGIIALIGVVILRSLTVIESLFDNKRVVTKNLNQLCEVSCSEVESQKREYLYLLNEKISKTLKISPPPIYLQNNDTDNAVAVNTGFFQAVVFELKTFEGLNAEGLGAVLAHELFHIQQHHYLKSIVRRMFITITWLLLNIFMLMNLSDILHLFLK